MDEETGADGGESGGGAVVEVSGLVVRFGELEALCGVSLRVERGELFGLLGPNGAGKTTLVRVLTGQLRPTSGRAFTMGVPPDDPIGMRRSAGIVPEAEAPPTFLTVQEFLELVCRIRQVEGVGERVARWLEFFQLEEKKSVLCRDLSKGQRQKVMLAAAFIHEPPLLILDEPLSSLDPVFQRRVTDHLRDFVARGGTVFMCTHILDLAEKLCSRVAVINRGRIVATGAPGELRGASGERLEEVFLRLVEGGG
ncbi:MAG: ABC transporter ATP-binding protein [Thermoplasmata archaeon]